MLQNFKNKHVFQDPYYFIAFGFGSGLLPFIPGTFGTVMGVFCYLLLAQLPLWAYLMTVVIATALGVWVCERVSNALGVQDYSGIVWDEMVGFWITMIGVPCDLMTITMGFLLFRLFDIWKPWPIAWADKQVHGGLGVMLDDILAAIPSCVILNLILFFINH